MEVCMTEREYMLWFSTVDISPCKKKPLLDLFGSAQDIFMAAGQQIQEVTFLTENEKDRFTQSRNETNFLNVQAALKREHILFCCLGDREYPPLLEKIYDPPIVLFYKGMLPDGFRFSVSIVGARACSNYGKEYSYHFGRTLAEHGIQIISGMARGIDGFSHSGALYAKGCTYAVLGCGVDIVYPPEHRRLYEEICASGGVLSEYPPGTQPLGFHFPMRNRIISGLSHGVLVVEARKRSGSLITADTALEQGRDVFALPGRAGDMLSCGTNDLIRQGACLVEKPEDILSFYGIGKGRKKHIKEEKKDLLLASNEKMVYSKLRLKERHLNRLSEETGMGTGALTEILLSLEARGLVGHTGQYFYRVLP